MQKSDIITRLKADEFYDIYSFFLKTGIWTSRKPYGIMSEVYSFLTIDEKHPKGYRLDTGCQGCIQKAAELILKTYPI